MKESNRKGNNRNGNDTLGTILDQIAGIENRANHMKKTEMLIQVNLFFFFFFTKPLALSRHGYILSFDCDTV